MPDTTIPTAALPADPNAQSAAASLEPQLAPPGAGLPFPEQFIAAALFRLDLWRKRPEQIRASLEQGSSEVLSLVESLSPEQASQRVLIERLRGLEDSSRYWSIYMALEHMRIVNNVVADAIRDLGNGKVPSRVASTAVVKPRETAGPENVGKFAASCQRVHDAAAGLRNLRTTAKYAHPWFGRLDAKGWYLLAAVHTHLHRQQIELIIRGLTRN